MVEMTNPAVIVVGKVAAMDLDWFASKPLFGRTIAVTRARTQASELVHMLRALGAQVLEVPTIVFAEPDDWRDVDCAIADVYAYDWLVLTSANGTDRFFGRLFKQGRDVRALGGIKIATIGAATSARGARVASQCRSRSGESHLRWACSRLWVRIFQDSVFCSLALKNPRDVLANGIRERAWRSSRSCCL